MCGCGRGVRMQRLGNHWVNRCIRNCLLWLHWRLLYCLRLWRGCEFSNLLATANGGPCHLRLLERPPVQCMRLLRYLVHGLSSGVYLVGRPWCRLRCVHSRRDIGKCLLSHLVALVCRRRGNYWHASERVVHTAVDGDSCLCHTPYLRSLRPVLMPARDLTHYSTYISQKTQALSCLIPGNMCYK